ncbi:MAG: RNA methyltransferase [Neisseriaceae bacterium]
MTTMSLPSLLENIYVILCHTSHPANIGSAARAMKTMGLKHLILVAPNLMVTPVTPDPPEFIPEKIEHFKLPEESFILAAGAKELLNQATIVSSLEQAIESMHLVCALTGRPREIAPKAKRPRSLMPELIQTAQIGKKVAFVFGSETFGLSIQEASLCNRLITIPGNPEYFSLNLAQAVQVIAYELLCQAQTESAYLFQTTPSVKLATRKEVSGLVKHWEHTMNTLGFFRKRSKDRLLRRLQRFIDKSAIETEEIDILRGFLSTIDQRLK